jgi:hypothetical protein
MQAQSLGTHMDLDTDKIDQATLALLALGRHEGYRAWKAFDWEVRGRLHAKGYITDPVGKAKSVLFTEDGAQESERLRGPQPQQSRIFNAARVDPDVCAGPVPSL